MWKNERSKNFPMLYLIVNKILMIVIPGYGTKSKAETVICLATFMGLYSKIACLSYYVVLSKSKLGRPVFQK
jgi:hypothetical protein